MDKIKIYWTQTGISSLENIVEYIFKDSEYYASNFAMQILMSIERLEFFSFSGRIVPEYNDKNLREIIYKNYRIVYNIKEDCIFILYVCHCAKLLPEVII